MHTDRTYAVPAWVTLTIVLGTAIVAFGESLMSVARRLDGTDAASLVLIAPFIGIACLITAVIRDGPPPAPKLEPAMLGAIPMMLAAVMIVVFGPGRLGFAFWYQRIDLVAMMALVASGLMASYGVRAVVRRGALAAFVLCLPPIMLPVGRALESLLAHATTWFAVRIAHVLPLGVDRVPGTSLFRGAQQVVSVTGECSGLEGIAIVLAIGGPLVIGTSGGRRRTMVVIGTGIALAFALNVVRVTTLLSLIGHGRMQAFDAVHAWAGAASIALVAATMLLLANRLGLRWHATDPRARVTYSRRHAAALGLVLVVGTALAHVAITTQGHTGLRITDVDRVVRLTQWRADDGTKLIAFTARGYIARYDGDYAWFREYFGRKSHASSYTITASGSDRPAWAQVIVSPSLRALDRYSPIDCAVAHDSKIVRVRRVPIGGGSATIVDQRLRGRYFAALSWTQPVRMPDGTPAFRRIQLFADAQRGADQHLPAPRTAVERVSYATLNVLKPYPDSSPRGRSFGPADRRLISIARSMIEHGT